MPTLAEDTLQHARQIHQDHPVILIHDHDPVADDAADCLAAGICGKVLLPVLDVFVDDNPHASLPVLDGWTAHARREFAKVRNEFRQVDDRAFLATSAADFRTAHRTGKLAVLLGAEGGKLLEGSLARLHELYAVGFRWLQVAWNCSNQIIEMKRGTEPRLTPFAREMIPELNRLGVIIDAMHAGRSAFFEMAELSKHPILLSHGGAHGALQRARHPGYGRGDFRSFVDDEMLRLQVQTGGLVGISFYGPLFFWEKGGSDIALADVADHFQYIAETVGVDVLALGCDYFPDYGGWAKFGPNVSRAQFVVPKNQLHRFTAQLLERGWSEADIAKVLGGNFLRFCERALTKVDSPPAL